MPAFDFYIENPNDGWNYPNYWASDGAGGGNNVWGSAYKASYLGDAPVELRGYYGPITTTPQDRTFDWSVSASINHHGWSELHSSVRTKIVLLDLPINENEFPPRNDGSGPDVPAATFDFITEAEIPWDNGGTPVADQKVLRFAQDSIKLARPGYDVSSATGNELIFGGVPRPLMYFSKRITFAGGETKTFTLPDETPANAVCLMQWQPAGATSRFLPSIMIGSSNQGVNFEFRWKIQSGNLIVYNRRPTSTDVLLLVLGTEPHTASSNDQIQKVVSGSDEHLRFVDQGNVILDDRYGYLPIIKAGTIDLRAYPSPLYRTVTFPQQDYIPFVLAWYNMRYRYSFALGGGVGYADAHYRQGFSYKRDANDIEYNDNFSANVTDSDVTFYYHSTGVVEGPNAISVTYFPLSIGYYVFGVPSFD
jgi:hypothetical protein